MCVGGVVNLADVVEKMGAGASLLQLFTGLVYQEPGLARGDPGWVAQEKRLIPQRGRDESRPAFISVTICNHSGIPYWTAYGNDETRVCFKVY